ncbi:hypothetical protein D3C84_838490 [compost metagenome]
MQRLATFAPGLLTVRRVDAQQVGQLIEAQRLGYAVPVVNDRLAVGNQYAAQCVQFWGAVVAGLLFQVGHGQCGER